MESEDTILSEELQKVYGFDKPQHLAGLEWQAAITAPIFFGEGRKAGIKEVVEWISEHQIGNAFSAISIPRFNYQTKLKEWGIKIGECDNVFS